MRKILYSNRFEKDIKTVKKYPKFNADLIKEYVELKANGKPLPDKAKDHKLIKSSPKQYSGLSDFHISPDICVVYGISGDSIILYRIGKHNNLGLTEDLIEKILRKFV